MDTRQRREGTRHTTQLFNSLKTFSERLFTESKKVQSEVRATKFSLNNCESEINSGFNSFFKLSETKFTENVRPRLFRKWLPSTTTRSRRRSSQLGRTRG